MKSLKNRSYIEIRRSIKDIRSLNLQSIGDSELEARLSILMTGYSCLTRSVKIGPAYRAQLLNAGVETFSNIGRLWYPPSDIVAKYGRLNQPGQSVMYLAGNHGTALLEMRPEIGSSYVIMELEQRNNREMAHLMEMGVAERVSEHGLPINVPLLENTDAGRSFLKGNARKNLAIRSFLASELIKIVPNGAHHLYRISASIANILMKDSKIDGVLYPSLAGNYSDYRGAQNIALKPEAADRLMQPKTCWIGRIESIDNAGIHVKCINKAKLIHENGTIEWS